MNSQPYEIELVVHEEKSRYPNDYHLSMMATVTGLSKAEVWARMPLKIRARKSWGGSTFRDVARALGYNVNLKFQKFDRDTPWPCIMRVQLPEDKSHWWALIYNQGTVYAPAEPWGMCPLEQFELSYPENKITSMLQIWMSTNQTLQHG